MALTGGPQSSFGFQDGHLSRDGGDALFLREVEARCGHIRKFSDCFEDRSIQSLIEDPVADLLSQRINGLIMGYEDLNDQDDLRRDPALALSVGKTDLEGQNRRDPNDRGKALAAHATLNRLELSTQKPDARYKKSWPIPLPAGTSSSHRECKLEGYEGTVETLQRMIPVIRKRFGKKVRIILLGDGGFAREEIMAWCEGQEKVYYGLG
ncbi:MAG: hypothetical protein ACJAVK_003426 [Akkermansiaceae bacterium]|jgi:hypothetical protein